MSQHIVVIGAGVVGMCSAHYAVKRGYGVTVVDRESPEHWGCSYGNAGMVVSSHLIPLAAPGMLATALKWMWDPESPFYLKPRLSPELLDWGWKFQRASTRAHVEQAAPLIRDLSLASRARFEELASLPNNEFGLQRKGLFMLCKTQRALDEEAETAGLANRLGVPAQVLSAKETAQLDPGVQLDITGAVYFPKDCHLTPDRFLVSLRRQVEASGVRFKWRSKVLGFSTEGRRITKVRTTAGDVEADQVVLCGGSWSAELGRQLRLRLPIQAGKGYSLTLPNPPELPQICSILTEARVAVTPMDGALRVGGTMEIAGLSEEINPRRVHGILKSLPKYYPAFSAKDFENVEPWVGLRPVSPDGLPYLGRTAKWDNLVIATGHAMMGLSLGPVSGQLVAEVLAGEKPSIDLTLLNPDRYG